MLFWIICGALALAVAGMIAVPLLRRDEGQAPERAEVEIYRAQLSEIERDIARGVLAGEEADRTRAEVARRLLAADAAAPASFGRAPQGATLVAGALVVALVAGGGLGLYRHLGAADASGPYPDLPRVMRLAVAEDMRAARPSQAEMMAEVLAETEIPPLPDEIAATLDRMRQSTEDTETDPGAWAELAWIELELRNYDRAFAAQDRLEALLPPNTPLSRRAMVQRLDMMVRAAGDRVSPEAEALAQELLAQNPASLPGRFYMGLLFFQTDRPDLAFRLWRGVVTDGPEGSPHARLARQLIEEAAARAGIEYQLPPQRGPTAEDMEAAGDMDPEARQAMIRNMVADLSERLANEGGPAEDWARLITSHQVLGNTGQARAILAEARQVFDGREADLAVIEAAAAEAGLR